MNEPMRLVSVVIPVRDSAATIEAAVVSAVGQDYSGSLEVVLAEGASVDGSRAIIEEMAAADPRIRVVDNPTGMTPSGLNAAIAESRGTIIVRCDAHAVLPTGYVTASIARLEETGAGVVGGVQDAVGESVFERAVAFAMAHPLGSGGAAYRTVGTAGPAETVYLGVFRREVLREVGLYDETLVRSQDYELNHRIRAAGHVVFFAPELTVRYRPRGSIMSLWRQYFAYGRWKRLVLRRAPGSMQLRQLAPPGLMVGLALSAIMLAIGQTAAGLVVPVAYGAAVMAAGLIEALRRRDPAGLLVPPVLITMHIGWGSGFLRGGTGSPTPRIPRLP